MRVFTRKRDCGILIASFYTQKDCRSNGMATDKQNSDDFMQGLGANEKAILERIPVLFLRKIAAGIVRAKMRVQFTGWLQYLLPMIFVLLFSIIGGIAHLLNFRFLAIPFLVLGTLIFIVAIFDQRRDHEAADGNNRSHGRT